MDRFRLYGVTIERSQGEVLITRVDAKDIVKISVVLHVILAFTKALANSCRLSRDRMRGAKNYVVFSGLLELQMYVQQLYIDRIDKNFIPNIQRIIDESLSLYQNTSELYESAEPEHKAAYKLNLESQARLMAEPHADTETC